MGRKRVAQAVNAHLALYAGFGKRLFKHLLRTAN
jgi:hypothetical protein